MPAAYVMIDSQRNGRIVYNPDFSGDDWPHRYVPAMLTHCVCVEGRLCDDKVPYVTELANSRGVFVTLVQLPGVPKCDIDRARRQIRAMRDVVGIEVARIDTLLTDPLHTYLTVLDL